MDRKITIIIFVILQCLCIVKSNGQDFQTNYFPLRNYKLKSQTRNHIRDLYKDDLSKLNHPSKKINKLQGESIISLANNFMMLDSASLLMESDTLTAYLNSIVDRIQQNNSSVAKNKYHLFTFRTDVPNASNSGNGVIYINLDLIAKFKSEAEIAYIICHEMSHDILSHVFHGIENRAMLLHNKGYGKEINKARRAYYNSFKKTDIALSKFLAAYTSYTRQDEFSADSLGLMLFKNAGYSPISAIAAIHNLDDVDKPLFTDDLDLKSHFDFPDYPFKSTWLNANSEAESIGQRNNSFSVPDSLKTHPDCNIRAKRLQEIINFHKMDINTKDVKTGNYSYFRTLAQFEEIELLLQQEAYSLVLYNSLHMLKKYPDNVYLHAAIANSLYEIYNGLLNHRFSKFAEFPDELFPKSYNNLLVFLHNLNTSALKNILIQYNNLHLKSNTAKNDFASYIQLLIISIDKPETDFTALVHQFEKNCSDSTYTSKLKTKLASTK